MTNQQHPIAPPPELVRQWDEECESGHNPEVNNTFDALQHFASKAARWGADQELEACVKWVSEYCLYFGDYPLPEDKLRAARRSKPPSLKEQALEAMSRCDSEMWCEEMEIDLAIIRTALESLPS